ncbi:hypothetical protein GGTG_11676 [Gaeumannomyces tritici R3-111a-1]|uniref:Uncharacterized protein n=1 Tax=Gaeumannomyces tritici (strain R3-111a-1) TaxID=644352 RepID=J3PDV3_GAET3|nr:hypothetical protein GGTG_11676 [Gaeumannomyces tritici R3-111a-1]EJT70653.1 hypothetical protein GGTG_11676 [Gaeumannomyces tritici R3-111a-1]
MDNLPQRTSQDANLGSRTRRTGWPGPPADWGALEPHPTKVLHHRGSVTAVTNWFADLTRSSAADARSRWRCGVDAQLAARLISFRSPPLSRSGLPDAK